MDAIALFGTTLICPSSTCRHGRTLLVPNLNRGGFVPLDEPGAPEELELSAADELEAGAPVLLAHGAYGPPEKLKGRKLFIVSRGDLGSGDKPRLPKIRAQYEQAPGPKELVILDGSAHAQFIFQYEVQFIGFLGNAQSFIGFFGDTRTVRNIIFFRSG